MIAPLSPKHAVRQELASRPAPRRALLLANSRARRVRELLNVVREQLIGAGLTLACEALSSDESPAALISRHRDEIDLVIVGGGDGTLNRVVDSVAGTGLPLGILPLGTANDLARTLEIPTSIPAACQVIAEGHMRAIDLGWVNGKHYFNVASLGLSVQIARELTGAVKRRWGVLAYLKTAARILWRARPFSAEIRSGSQRWPLRTVQIAVGNGRYYGGGMAVADDAEIDDQRLDLYSLEVRRAWQVLPLLYALWRGRLRDRPWVRTLAAKEFEIRTRRPCPINTDGEITTRTPAKFRVVPRALRVYVPASAEGLHRT